MTDSVASTAQVEPAAPAVVANPAPEQVITGAPPTAGTDASPDSEALRLKKSQETRERIEELNAKAKAGIEYGEFWRKQFEESQRKPPVTVAAPQEPQPDPEPQADQFDDVTAYTRAYATWARKEAVREATGAAEKLVNAARSDAEKATQKAREEARLSTLEAGFAERQRQFAEKTADYVTAISNPALTFFNGDVLEAIKGSERGPEIAYHIAKDPKLVAKLASQSVPQRLTTLGRIEAELSRPPPPPKVTAAPAPPTPVGSGSGGEPDPSSMTTTDWMTWRTKQIMAKRQAR